MWNGDKIASAIFCSDLHIGDYSPVSRLDNFIETQFEKLNFIFNLSKNNNNCPIIVAGDFFHHWKQPPEILSKIINLCFAYIDTQIITVAGQHDLPFHSWDQIGKSALWTLHETGIVRILAKGEFIHFSTFSVQGFSYGDKYPDKQEFVPNLKTVTVIHELVYLPDDPPYPDAPLDGVMTNICNKLYWADCILSGDNHNTFTTTAGKTLLVNCGSIFRISAAQIEHKPSVFLYYASSNEVKQVFLPVKNDIITREHIDTKEELDDKISQFMSRLTTIRVSNNLDFMENLKIFFEQNNIGDEIKKLILEAYE